MPNLAIFRPKNADVIKKVGHNFFHFSETPNDFQLWYTFLLPSTVFEDFRGFEKLANETLVTRSKNHMFTIEQLFYLNYRIINNFYDKKNNTSLIV